MSNPNNNIERILLTGATGLLGSHALLAWQRRFELYALVRKLPPHPISSVCYVETDLAQGLDAEQLPERVDAVVHLAQSSRMREFPTSAMEMFNVNTASTAALLDWAWQTGAKSFVYASTGGLYASGNAPFSETSPIDPEGGELSYYFDTKRCSEALVTAYQEKLRTVVVRPFFVFGPGQRQSMLLPRLIENVRQGLPIRVLGGTGPRLNPIYVTDAVQALTVSLKDEVPSVLNLAGGEIITIRDIAQHIGQLIGQTPKFEEYGERPADVIADISVLRTHVMKPLVSCRDGITNMLSEKMNEPDVNDVE